MKLLATTIIVLAFLYLLNYRLVNNKTDNDMWIVYGSPKCGWTRKQLKHMDDKGIAYMFINCDNDECPKDVRAFPTLDGPNGVRHVGFSKIQ
jgi:hypothetical protein